MHAMLNFWVMQKAISILYFYYIAELKNHILFLYDIDCNDSNEKLSWINYLLIRNYILCWIKPSSEVNTDIFLKVEKVDASDEAWCFVLWMQYGGCLRLRWMVTEWIAWAACACDHMTLQIMSSDGRDCTSCWFHLEY